MKKINYLIIISLFSMSFLANAGQPDFVRTGEDIKYYSKVRYGIPSGLVGVEKSEVDRYKFTEVVSYRKDGCIYERMPVIRNNKETGNYAFMELLTYKNGMKVYRHKINTGVGASDEYQYLVYRDGNYVVTFDDQNAETLNMFFFRPSTDLARK